MNFLIDAQLPRRLAHAIRAQNHDVLHTLDLPEGNSTTDDAINSLSEREERIVISKDADFVSTFLVQKKPHKLLLISTGNISNADLEKLLLPQLEAIVSAFQDHSFIELTRDTLIIHR